MLKRPRGVQLYWPPELALAYLAGAEQLQSSGKAVDLWALGCVVYECLTGHHPISTQAEDTDSLGASCTFDSDARQREQQLLHEVIRNSLSRSETGVGVSC